MLMLQSCSYILCCCINFYLLFVTFVNQRSAVHNVKRSFCVQTQHPEPCQVCGDSTGSCEHARMARNTRHRCGKCARKFESAAALQVHERVHTGEKPEVCEVCARTFQHRSNLQKHMMKHTGRRPHVCTLCPRAFYARHSLKAHMRKHTGVTPFHCETCGKRFCTKNSLQV